MLSPQDMQVFLAAAETENFSEAARRLGISQPSVSMQIKGLERRLDVQLFVRSGRHVALSDAGMVLVPMARQLVSRAIQIEESMASLKGDVVGLLKLACSTTAGKYVLPPLLAQLQERHPRVSVACNVTQRSAALDSLIQGDSHIALTSLREPSQALEYRPFVTDRIVLITPPDHPWTRSTEPLDPHDLTTGRFIVREDGSGTTEAVRAGLAWHNLGMEDLNPIMVLGNAEAIRMAVQQGIGVAFVSAMVAAEVVESGSIAVLEIAGLDLSTTLYMTRVVDRPASQAQAVFWDLAFSPENEPIRLRPSQPATALPG